MRYEDEEHPRKPNWVYRFLLLTGAVLPFLTVGTFALASDDFADPSLSLLLFALSLLAGCGLLVALVKGPKRAAPAVALAVHGIGMLAVLVEGLGALIPSRGRQLRGPHGRVLPQRDHADESTHRAAIAWRNNADTETASISAFSLLSLELAELGAPLSLLRAAHQDALDELRHSELCDALARELGDTRPSVAAMPGLRDVRTRPCDIARVAVESWIEGAYLEAVSATLAMELSSRTVTASIRDVLAIIAVDEARHATHAWEIIEWCLSRERSRTSLALAEAMERIPVPSPSEDEPGSDGALECFGIAGRELQRAVAERCLADCKARLSSLLRVLPGAGAQSLHRMQAPEWL